MKIEERIEIGAVELGKHEFLLRMRGQAIVRTIYVAALVDTDQKEFVVASAVIDSVSPSTEWIGTIFFDTARRVIEVDDANPAKFVRVGGGNSAGAPSGGAFGVYRLKAILQCLFNRSLHGIQVDLTVALNIDVSIEGELECLRNLVSRMPSVLIPEIRVSHVVIV